MGNISNQFLTFKINGNDYAINIEKIDKLMKYKEMGSRVSDNKCILGLISVFDNVRSVVDLKYILNKEYTDLTINGLHYILLKDSNMILLVETFNKIVAVSEDEIQTVDINNDEHVVIKKNNSIYYLINESILDSIK